MNTTVSPLLRGALLVDIVGAGAAILVLLFGTDLLAHRLGLPAGLLWWAAITLLPFLVLLGLTARRDTVPTSAVRLIVALNLVLVVASTLALIRFHDYV